MLLSSRVAEGHPARVREVILLFEATGAHTTEAQEARALLPSMASVYLNARLAEGGIVQIYEAIYEAEAEGLSEQVAEARIRLPRLVRRR